MLRKGLCDCKLDCCVKHSNGYEGIALVDVERDRFPVRGYDVPPWIWIMDDMLDFSALNSIRDEEYQWFFPVAIDSLLPDLCPMLLSAVSLRELWGACPFDEEHPIWTNAYGL